MPRDIENESKETALRRLEEKVAQFIETHGLFAGAEGLLLAVSGGADSIALLHVMQTLASQGIIAADLLCTHVNHQLRGAASDGDAAFVTAEAAKLDLPIVTTTADVKAYAKSHKLSIETAGRQVRLAWLGETARTHRCAWIATGHQKDDNAETVLHRLHRGTGFRGLAGIWPSRSLDADAHLARPLLCCRRSEIVAYLQARNLPWREDWTNTDCAYTRNYLRHRLLPALESESADSLVEPLASLATSATRLARQVGEQAALATSRHVEFVDGEVVIDAGAMAALPEMVAVELIRFQLTALGCGERNLTQHHYRDILDMARPRPDRTKLTLPGGVIACREYEKLILRSQVSPNHTAMPVASAMLNIPGVIDYTGCQIEARILDHHEIEKIRIKGNQNAFVEYLDLDRLELPLAVRPRRAGDRFHPLGLAGEKRVGKFLTAARVPEKQRRRVLVFEDKAQIVWICPIRISERAKVTHQTRRILALRVSD